MSSSSYRRPCLIGQGVNTHTMDRAELCRSPRVLRNQAELGHALPVYCKRRCPLCCGFHEKHSLDRHVLTRQHLRYVGLFDDNYSSALLLHYCCMSSSLLPFGISNDIAFLGLGLQKTLFCKFRVWGRMVSIVHPTCY